MDKAIIQVGEYLQNEYCARYLSREEGLPFVDPNEYLICCFSFPDESARVKLIGNDKMLYQDLIMLFLYDYTEKEVFIRICNGEARGMPWEKVQLLCDILQRSMKK